MQKYSDKSRLCHEPFYETTGLGSTLPRPQIIRDIQTHLSDQLPPLQGGNKVRHDGNFRPCQQLSVACQIQSLLQKYLLEEQHHCSLGSCHLSAQSEALAQAVYQ